MYTISADASKLSKTNTVPLPMESFEASAEMVYIYSTKCGWCDRFNPTWADFTEKYKGPIKLVKIESQEPAAKNYAVTGYPTVMIVKDGVQQAVFKDERTVEKLIEFANVSV